MHFAWNYLFILIWLAYLISSGIYIFSKGFLLSRVSLVDTSSCRKLSENPMDEYFITENLVNEVFKDVNASSELCLPKKSKVILLVVDALKYEFGVYNRENLEPKTYENKLKIFNELLLSQPNNSRLLKFRADPPTTTLQRLKGLTTGSFPTFIDIGSNFATAEINEDNIIDQITKSGLPAVFLGDSTWTELYPKRFKRQYSYPSFDIYDLDSVDKEIMKNLPNELINDDWDLLVAHFLGVDHCGHRYGPLHTEMSRKLTEMDEIIRLVIETMDESTTLFVFGDHGMTVTGDHGGESEDEVNSMLFAYSKTQKFVSSQFEPENNTMQQIDIVPTVAALLGVPIPYSNLGLIQLHLLPDIKVRHLSQYQILLLHVWQNAKQIYNYFYNYALEHSRSFHLEEMDNLENRFQVFTHRVNTIYTEAAFKSFTDDLNIHLREILQICRKIWVNFDATFILQGLLMTILPIFFIFILVNNAKAYGLSKIFSTTMVGLIYLSSLVGGIFAYVYYKEFGMKSEEHSIIVVTNVIGVKFLGILTIQNWSQLATNWSKKKNFSNLPTRFVYFISVMVFFSNSFIIQEQKILSYLLIGSIIMLMFDVCRETYKSETRNKFKWSVFLKSTTLKLILLTVFAISCIRFAHSLFICREEQGNCLDFASALTTLRKGSGTKFYLTTVVVVVLYTTLTRIYFRSCGNLTGFSVNVTMARYGPTVAAICAGGHILLSNANVKNVKMSYVDSLALVIYALFFLQIFITFCCPLMTYVLKKNNSLITIGPNSSIIPEIFKKMKRIYAGDEEDRTNDVPIVYGLATVYSSILISFSVFLTLVIVILLDARGGLGIFVCISSAAVILVLNGIQRYKITDTLESCLQPTFTALVSWVLCAQFSFYATSHQPTMSQIDWRAAFIGRSANFDNSNVISAVLVILNTFGGHILFYVLYGLLCSETFSIFALFPTLIRLKTKQKTDASEFRQTTVNTNPLATAYQNFDYDITRGELILYENEKIYFGSLFKVACQFYMLQGVKVFFAMLACTIHCRHLMVWKIFAPRFIYEGLSTYISLPSLIFGYLIYARVHWSIKNLINQINKLK